MEADDAGHPDQEWADKRGTQQRRHVPPLQLDKWGACVGARWGAIRIRAGVRLARAL